MIFSNSASKIVLATVLSTSLLVGGCKNKNADTPKKAASEIVKVESRKVNEADAQKALAAFSLDKSGSGTFEWADKSGAKGHYTYKDVTIKGDDKNAVKVGKMELVGAHMDGEKAAFDKIVFNDFRADDKEADVSIEKLSLIKPSPTLTNALARAFSGDEDAFENVEGDISFGAFELAGMNVKAEDGNMSLNHMSFGEAKDKTGVFSLKDMKFENHGKGENVSMSLESVHVNGANIQKYKDLFSTAIKEGKNKNASEDAIRKMMSGMNPYDPDFKDFSIRGFKVDADGMKINLDSYEGKADKKGDKVHMSVKMSPLTIVPPKDTQKKELKEFNEALQTMGYDKLEFIAGGKSVLDAANDSMKTDDTYFEMKDGFRLSYNYDLAGYKAFLDKIMEASANGQSAKNPMAVMGAMGSLKVNKLKLTLRDDSFIDRSFKLAAKQKGGTPEQLKQQAKMGLAFAGMMAKDEAQQKLATELSTAVTKLIDEGGTLVIDMNPDSEVNLGALMAGGKGGNFDISKLGITISHK